MLSRRLGLAAAIALCLPLATHAASLDIDFPGVPVSEGGTFSGETRIVHFELTETVVLTSLSARIGTVEAGDFGTTTTPTPISTWSIVESDASASLGATIATTDAGISFSSLDQSAEIYTTSVSIKLDPGFYFVGLKIDTPILYTYFRENVITLPFLSEDGVFRVLDGVLIQEANPTRVIASNVALPAYRIGYDIPISDVPLPGGLLLLLGGLGGLTVLRKTRRAR